MQQVVQVTCGCTEMAGSCSHLQERAEAKGEQRRSECKALHTRVEALQHRLQQKDADLELAGHQATLKASQLSATIQRCGHALDTRTSCLPFVRPRPTTSEVAFDLLVLKHSLLSITVEADPPGGHVSSCQCPLLSAV